jgi:hypothetical protein
MSFFSDPDPLSQFFESAGTGYDDGEQVISLIFSIEWVQQIDNK